MPDRRAVVIPHLVRSGPASYLDGVRAGFSDPHGPKLWRVLTYALPALAMLFAMFGPISGNPALVTFFLGFAALNLLGLFDFRQRKVRMADVVCGAGHIIIKKAGTRNQRILAHDITGATTARTSSGLLLTLQHRKRTAPLTLELANDAEVEKVRHALGIGHGGFGEIAWRTQSEPTQGAAFVGRIFAIIGAIAIAMAVGSSDHAAVGLTILLGTFGFVGAIISLVAALSPAPPPTIIMTAMGIRLKTPFGWFALPYDALSSVEDDPQRLVFRIPDPYKAVVVNKSSPFVGGPTPNERRIATKQLEAAAQRARGLGPQKTDVTGRVDVLRRNGEPARDWLVRLDMAGQMLAAGSGYRGNTLDVEDLWAILEDPEAEPQMRAAAARVLRHAPQTKIRIDSALAAVRDDSTNRRLRIAMQDDLDGASQALALLDAEERLSVARQNTVQRR